MSVGNFLIFSSPENNGTFRGKINNTVFTCNVNVTCKWISFWNWIFAKNAQTRARNRHLQGTALILSHCMISIGDDKQEPRRLAQTRQMKVRGGKSHSKYFCNIAVVLVTEEEHFAHHHLVFSDSISVAGDYSREVENSCEWVKSLSQESKGRNSVADFTWHLSFIDSSKHSGGNWSFKFDLDLCPGS